MSLITCYECKKIYSDKAAACIHCGYPTEANMQIKSEYDTQSAIESNEDANLWNETTESYTKNSFIILGIAIIIITSLTLFTSKNECKYLESYGVKTSKLNSGSCESQAMPIVDNYEDKEQAKNTLTYSHSTGEVKLNLAIKQETVTKNSFIALINFSNYLSEAHTGVGLPSEISAAIRSHDKLPFSMVSENFRWTIDKVLSEKQGYQLVFTIKDKKTESKSNATAKTKKSVAKHRLLESSSDVESRFNNSDFLTQMQSIIRRSGYRCDSFSGILEMKFTSGFTVWCNNYQYNYEVEDRGGNWVVTLD